MKRAWITLFVTLILTVAVAVPLTAQTDIFFPLATSMSEAIGEAISLHLQPGDTASVHCSGDRLDVTEQDAQSLDLLCVALPTATPTHTPTNTPPPTPTNTPPPTPTATPSGPIAPFADAPLCPTHDSTAFHTLWDETRGCHYTHGHGDDPNGMDDLFGPLVYGQEVSYPWQTFAGADATYKPIPSDPSVLENNAKHEGYHWLTARDLSCANQGPVCIKAFRTVTHILPHKTGALTRFHSFYVDALLCHGPNRDVCGVVRRGGWMDFNVLLMDATHYPLPSDPPPPILTDRRRDHRWFGGPRMSNSNRDAAWYGRQTVGIVEFAVIFETLTVMNPNDGLSEHYFCDAYATMDGDPSTCPAPWDRQNGSGFHQHILGFRLDDATDGVVDGKVNINGYSDRHGKIVQGCTAVGLDCIPFVIENLPAVGGFNINSRSTATPHTEIDIVLPGTYWLRYPVHP